MARRTLNPTAFRPEQATTTRRAVVGSGAGQSGPSKLLPTAMIRRSGGDIAGAPGSQVCHLTLRMAADSSTVWTIFLRTSTRLRVDRGLAAAPYIAFVYPSCELSARFFGSESRNRRSSRLLRPKKHRGLVLRRSSVPRIRRRMRPRLCRSAPATATARQTVAETGEDRNGPSNRLLARGMLPWRHNTASHWFTSPPPARIPRQPR